MIFEEKTLEREYVYKGKVVNLRCDNVLLHNGNTSIREVVEHNGGVAIVAMKDNKIILVKQFRKPYEEVLLEIPAGKLEKNEEPYECAIRELEEETGFIPQDLKLLNIVYTSPGFANEKIHIYYCCKLIEGRVNPDEDENIEVEYYSVDEAEGMIASGQIRDAKTIIGILMAKKYI
jgi:ADP-ribose pyrophosphatase